PRSTLFPYTTLFRSVPHLDFHQRGFVAGKYQFLAARTGSDTNSALNRARPEAPRNPGRKPGTETGETRETRRAIEEFNRLKALRHELPNEPAMDTQPEATETINTPDPLSPAL